MILHDFQKTAIDDITTEAANGHKRIILQAPTGSGKTVLASQLVLHAVSNGQRVLFLVHRRELLWQTQEKLKAFGIDCAILLPDEPYDPSALACVASIQTLHARAIRRQILDLPKADLVI